MGLKTETTVLKEVSQMGAESPEDSNPDFEFAQGDGMLNISRFVPEKTLNKISERRKEPRDECTTE